PRVTDGCAAVAQRRDAGCDGVVAFGGGSVLDAAKAVALLEYLMTHPDELITRERLLDAVWGWDYPAGTRAVDTRIAELRRALGDDPDRPSFIETAPGQGYRFVGLVEAAP
ncbi:MAG: iron-containing alcohol dehydrogenase, partial [Chloroflexi bacterium]|nr:iron-containing alcohol dehydrogenase [Chloroflexota bacterium]